MISSREGKREAKALISLPSERRRNKQAINQFATYYNGQLILSKNFIVSHRKNTLPSKSSHMQQSVNLFHEYLKNSQTKCKTSMKLGRSCNTEVKLKTIKPKSVLKNESLESTIPPLLKKAPMFILSKNPCSRIVNAKSCLGRILLKQKTDTHLKCYRINRGDNTTIMPIAVKKIIAHGNKIRESKVKHM